MKIFTNWFKRKHDDSIREVRCKPYRRSGRFLASHTRGGTLTSERVSDRQERLAGFDQSLLSSAHVALIGAGMNGEVAEGLVRKGVGALTIVDFDEVSWSNLNRQFYFPWQEGQMKAHCLAENLLPHATAGTLIRSISLSLGGALQSGHLDLNNIDVLVVAVDNTAARIEASEAARELCPVVFTAVDLAGEAAYVAVQKPGEACYGCLLPHALTPQKLPCAAPAIKDTNKFAGGAVLFAIDTLLMPARARTWNYCEFHLAGVVPSWTKLIPRRQECPLCNAPLPQSRSPESKDRPTEKSVEEAQ